MTILPSPSHEVASCLSPAPRKKKKEITRIGREGIPQSRKLQKTPLIPSKTCYSIKPTPTGSRVIVEMGVRVELDGLTEEMGFDLRQITLRVTFGPDLLPDLLAALGKLGSQPLGVEVEDMIEGLTTFLEFLVGWHTLLCFLAYNWVLILKGIIHDI
jgi:hypothetical protein